MSALGAHAMRAGSEAEVRAAWRETANRLHPDRHHHGASEVSDSTSLAAMAHHREQNSLGTASCMLMPMFDTRAIRCSSRAVRLALCDWALS